MNYQENGYQSREDYLRCFADDNGLQYEEVLTVANTLGEDEDFDALVSFFEVTPVNSWVNMLTPATPKQNAPVVTKKQRVRNWQTHPKSGGKTYAVWVQMRYYLAVHKLPLKQAKAAVRAWGVQNNQMPNMVNAQIYRFCKYYGLIGK